MANQYTSEKHTIGELLSLTSPNTIVVPDWQRSFSWTQKEIDIFWQDLTAFSNRYQEDTIKSQEYFLGSVVIVLGDDKSELLDGQQRMATATILLSVISEYLVHYSEKASTRTIHSWINEIDDATQSQRFKLSLNYYDREFFRQAVQTHPRSADPTPTHDSHKLILKARKFFESKFESMYEELGGGRTAYDWTLRVRRVLTDHMSVVSVSSADEDNAASVFETLNDRGIGLSTPDLLRTLLLRRANEGDREEIIKCWDGVLGLEKKVDQFLRHFWLSRYGDVKTQSLYREMKSIILAENTSSLEMSRELRDEASLYADLSAGVDEDASMQRLLVDVKLLAANSLYTPLLSAYAKYDVDGRRDLLRWLVVYFVRHNVIGNLENSQLETVVFTAAKDIRANASLDSVTETLRTSMPSDADFKTKFGTALVKRMNTQRYLLRKLEEHRIATAEVAPELPDMLHVEHIYPKEPLEGERWVKHDVMLNRLGNLTLLAKGLNTAAKNKVFADKKGYYESSVIQITKELLESEKWDATAVDDRQRAFAEIADEIWSLPLAT